MFNKLRSRNFLVGLFFSFLVIGINYIKVDNVQKVFQRIEGILYDARLLLTLPEQQRQFDEHVIIIDIDEKSMREQGRYPWSRSKISDLVTKLMDAGVVVVAFDIFFAEAEHNPVDVILQKNKQLNSDARTELQSYADSVNFDKEFAKTLSNAEVVLGFLFDNSAQTSGQLPKNKVQWSSDTPVSSQIAVFDNVLANYLYCNLQPQEQGLLTQFQKVMALFEKHH